MIFMEVPHLDKELFLKAESGPDIFSFVEILLLQKCLALAMVILLKASQLHASATPSSQSDKVSLKFLAPL
jgi:hypothetical protein